MANIVIKGVYTSASALTTAEAATASNGDTYIVGTKIPYDLYTYKSSASKFEKGDKISNYADELSTPVTFEDLTEPIPIQNIYDLEFIGNDSKPLMIRKGLHLGEIRLYVPAQGHNPQENENVIGS